MNSTTTCGKVWMRRFLKNETMRHTNREPLLLWFLHRLNRSSDRESLSGDLREEYEDLMVERGKIPAFFWMWKQVLTILPARLKSFIYWRFVMGLYALKIAWRNIRKYKVFSFINIAGLAAGTACCILILLWVQDELSYDHFHENYDRIQRTTLKMEGRWTISSPWALGDILVKDYPEVLARTRIASRDVTITAGDKSINETTVFVDPEFFKIFTFPFIEGDQNTALNSVQSAVLTESTALSLFGKTDPIGKIVTINNSTELTITGVIEDVPANSHIRFRMVGSVNVFGEETLNSWALESWTYLLLDNNTNAGKLEEKMAGLVMTYDTRIEQKVYLHLQPLSRAHLYALDGGGRITNVYIFSCIAVFILLIACINFMNLSTAKGETRALEVGIRKVVGSRRGSLVRQFFGESLLHAFVAMVLALGLVRLLLPAFNNLAQKTIRPSLLLSPPILLGIFGITLLTGVFSGSYPALFLSSFQPIKVLGGRTRTSSGRPFLRKSLVVLQFTIAVVLLIGTAVLYKQLHYIHHKDLGYNREHIINLPSNQSHQAQYLTFKEEVLRNPHVISMTAATSRPNQIGNINPTYWEGRGPDQ
ncbi:MAG: ABC transporter permease, partial [Candidatus Aminicenantes bacterium]|nr:ABC transporter permease [Candidatus Aminicenantes bacterium]